MVPVIVSISRPASTSAERITAIMQARREEGIILWLASGLSVRRVVTANGTQSDYLDGLLQRKCWNATVYTT